jgi:hypothetical protein
MIISCSAWTENEVTPTGQCLAYQKTCLAQGSQGTTAIMQKVYLPMRGVEEVFRARISARLVVLKYHQKATIVRFDYIICRTRWKWKSMVLPGAGKFPLPTGLLADSQLPRPSNFYMWPSLHVTNSALCVNGRGHQSLLCFTHGQRRLTTYPSVLPLQGGRTRAKCTPMQLSTTWGCMGSRGMGL